MTLLLAHDRIGVIGHRGDSRAYLARDHRVHQLTTDHDLTDDIGLEPAAESAFDVFALDLEPGDTIVLCTDGAEQIVEDPEIARAAGHLSPRVLSSQIVRAAHERSPACDATAVVVRVRTAAEPGWLELSVPPRDSAFAHTLMVAQAR